MREHEVALRAESLRRGRGPAAPRGFCFPYSTQGLWVCARGCPHQEGEARTVWRRLPTLPLELHPRPVLQMWKLQLRAEVNSRSPALPSPAFSAT